MKRKMQMMMLRRFVLAAIVTMGAGMAQATCENISFRDIPHTVCTIEDPASLRLFLRDDSGNIFGNFSALSDDLKAKGQALGFAVNGGMYHPDRAPVGLYIENGETVRSIVTSDGPGNFGLLPNGVFCLDGARAYVIESRRFAANPLPCRYATQSGPMLVIDGDLHPRFLPDSTSRKRRNGVGVRPDGTVVFAISRRSVTFHAFGSLFRDGLGTPNALFLDGSISRLYAPELSRSDFGARMGPIIGQVRPN